jgi:hypothetical protein
MPEYDKFGFQTCQWHTIGDSPRYCACRGAWKRGDSSKGVFLKLTMAGVSSFSGSGSIIGLMQA